MMLKSVIFIYFYAILFGFQPLNSRGESFGPVFNDGLSKMEMIEKMDQYLSKELPNSFERRDQMLADFKAKYDEDMNGLKGEISRIKTSLEQLSKRLDDFGQNKPKETGVDKNFFNDLKNVIIPALQEKVIQNEQRFNQFVRDMMSQKDLELKIKNEVGNE